MSIDFHGKLDDRRKIRAGFIGRGCHAFRNITLTATAAGQPAQSLSW